MNAFVYGCVGLVKSYERTWCRYLLGTKMTNTFTSALAFVYTSLRLYIVEKKWRTNNLVFICGFHLHLWRCFQGDPVKGCWHRCLQRLVDLCDLVGVDSISPEAGGFFPVKWKAWRAEFCRGISFYDHSRTKSVQKTIYATILALISLMSGSGKCWSHYCPAKLVPQYHWWPPIFQEPTFSLLAF